MKSILLRSRCIGLVRSALVCWGLLLYGLSAHAVDYIFPPDPNANPAQVAPTNCSGTPGTYVCGALSMDSDNLTLGPGVTVSAAVTTTTGAITLKEGVRVEGGVTSTTGVITLSDKVYINGGITSTSGTITLRKSVQVVGALTSTSGVITVGDLGIVGGAITNADSGSVMLGEGVQVVGSITTTMGDVTAGHRSKIGGNITVTTGVISVGDWVQIAGSVTGTTSAIQIGQGSWVGESVTATTGGVTLGYLARVCGSITITTGNINAGPESRVGGNITATGTISLGTQSQVGGAITGTTGALNLSDRVQVGGVITASTGPISIGEWCVVSGSITSSGPVLIGGHFNELGLTLAAACVAPIQPPPVTSAAAGAFACLDTSISAAGVASNHKLYTKLAGTPFAFDVVALKGDGTVELDYVSSSGAAKSVTVELVDGSSSLACADKPSLFMGSATFAAGNISGRTTSGSFSVPNAYASLRCRVTDASAVKTCSSDNFAVRPAAFVVTLSTATTPTPATLKAGSAFTLQAKAVASDLSATATLYTATPTLNLGPASTTGTPGFTLSALTPQALPGATLGVSSAIFTYDEVGSFTLNASLSGPYGVSDSSFTAVDSTTDCVAGSAANTVDSLGRYGCVIGQSAALAVGRFYPDHFDITPEFVAGCAAGGFTYMEQPFIPRYTVTAKSMARTTPGSPGNTALALYGAALLKLGAVNAGTDLTSRLLPVASSPPTSGPTWTKGSYTFDPSSADTTFSRPTTTTPDSTWGPYDALDIGVAVDDADGAGFAAGTPGFTASVPATCQAPTSSACKSYASLMGGVLTKMRQGRLKLSNAYGSEKHDLKLPVTLQYWTALGWQTNSLDTCSLGELKSSHFAFDFPVSSKNKLLACNTALTVNTAAAPTLSAPGAGKNGWADITLNLDPITAQGNQCSTVGGAGPLATTAGMPWLQSGSVPPKARATFGVFKSPLIYRRENF